MTNPGVGQRLDHHTIMEHSYYQWVPLVLAMIGVSFYIPRSVGLSDIKTKPALRYIGTYILFRRFLWKIFEGGLMRKMCASLKFESRKDKNEE